MIYTFRFSILGENCDGYDAHVLLQLEAQLSGEAKHRLETEYKNIIENEKPNILIELHEHKSSLLPQGAYLPTLMMHTFFSWRHSLVGKQSID
ncbi:unnamed protein product [Prunus armeniaca]|uniref:Uncharacterized protein n=1 Tax=Prunus armeniaca TaxID=36596 RepID=A0A6J5UAT8_PRUAR|nr:unnamed protein product [Prunus armeniaca]